MPTPLNAMVQTQQLTDAELRLALNRAMRESQAALRDLAGKEGIGASVRRAQLQLAEAQIRLWRDVGDATRIGIGDAIDSAALWQAGFDERLFVNSAINPGYWYQSMLHTARSGIESYIASKGVDGYTLSQRVYRNRQLASGLVRRTVDSGILLGKSAREIAADVTSMIKPTAPGGVSYSAMRLARTEINNAYHAQSTKQYQNTPWVVRVRWNLSGSHPRPDTCNDYAEDTHFTGGNLGEFLPMEVPAKPHPNCLCYTTPVTPSQKEFARNFKSGQYDNYVERTMGCARSA